MTEIWKPIPGIARYCASSEGRIRHVIASKPRKLTRQKNGYLFVGLWNLGKLKCITVHSLIARTFIGERPEGMQVRHLDGDPSNNHVANLAYGSAVENAADREAHSNTARGERNGMALICDADVGRIRALYATGKITQYELATVFGISQAQVNNIILNKQRTKSADLNQHILNIEQALAV